MVSISRAYRESAAAAGERTLLIIGKGGKGKGAAAPDAYLRSEICCRRRGRPFFQAERVLKRSAAGFT